MCTFRMRVRSPENQRTILLIFKCFSYGISFGISRVLRMRIFFFCSPVTHLYFMCEKDSVCNKVGNASVLLIQWIITSFSRWEHVRLSIFQNNMLTKALLKATTYAVWPLGPVWTCHMVSFLLLFFSWDDLKTCQHNTFLIIPPWRNHLRVHPHTLDWSWHSSARKGMDQRAPVLPPWSSESLIKPQQLALHSIHIYSF